ncbi:MAG: GTPase domain-containing protein [Promethearchaeota archaeon]
MVNVGLLGAVSVGKTTILRLFVRYIEENKTEDLEGGVKCSIVKTDFSGESVLKPGESKETKTIHPNRVIFREDATKKNHTLFAPGGDRERAVVKMGIITISRIVRQVVAVFDVTRPIDVQFAFFKDVRFFPKEIVVCLNKFDLVDEGERDKTLEEFKGQIADFFEKRKIKVKSFHQTCAEPNDEFQEFNDNTAKMILEICTGT